MSPVKTLICLAALLITTISAIPTQIQGRAGSCPPGNFRMKLYTQNANGQMVWNGQYAKALGGPLGSTSSASAATWFSVDSSSNLIESSAGYAACILTAPFQSEPTNSTVILTKQNCQGNGYPMVECIKTPQYNMCWAGPNNVVQQCGQFISFNPRQSSSADGTSCGPALNFFIENC